MSEIDTGVVPDEGKEKKANHWEVEFGTIFSKLYNSTATRLFVPTSN
jgi:hypothetical protein